MLTARLCQSHSYLPSRDSRLLSEPKSIIKPPQSRVIACSELLCYYHIQYIAIHKDVTTSKRPHKNLHER